jgi:hypothetical protein
MAENEEKALWALAETRPTTPAGAVALIRYAWAQDRMREGVLEGEWEDAFFNNLTAALTAMT